jgi:hypothetical protein
MQAVSAHVVAVFRRHRVVPEKKKSLVSLLTTNSVCAHAGKLLRSLGGTQIVDFSQVNRAGFDPTVKEIVSQKFFGSDGARMKVLHRALIEP